MDIHRCRFVPLQPSSINALSFSHESNLKENSPHDLRLALGRGNGDVEIWNPQNGKWSQETIIRGRKGSTIEQLLWTQDTNVDDASEKVTVTNGPLRLFSTDSSSSITEWDLSSGVPKRYIDGNAGDIWCFAAQPRIQTPQATSNPENSVTSQLLAAGCRDGSIILFSTEDDDLRYSGVLMRSPSKRSKILSLTWRDRKTIIAGYEESVIRVVDVPSRAIVRTMSLGKPANGKNSVVWTVKCLANGTIVSGDSSGELKIWDATNFSLVQRLKTHQADILDIATSFKGDTIFSFGIDRRTVVYKPVAAQKGTKQQRWTQVMHRRFHQHDVKCGTSFESKDMSVVVSGGVDTNPVVTPLKQLQSEYHRTLPSLPQRPQVSCSKRARLLVAWSDQDMLIYHFPRRSYGEALVDTGTGITPSYDLLARIRIEEDEHIQSAQISDKGDLVVAATRNSTRLFQLRKSGSGGQLHLRTRRVELPPALSKFGARLVGFSPDCKWLYSIRPDSTIVLHKTITAESPKEPPMIFNKAIKLRRSSRPQVLDNALGDYVHTINNITFSSDSRILAVSDISGAIDVWILDGHEDITEVAPTKDTKSDDPSDSSDSESDSDSEDDSQVLQGQKWIRNQAGSKLPNLQSAILTMSFRPEHPSSQIKPENGNIGLHATRHNPHPISHTLPTADDRLIAITATHQLVEFDVLQCKLSDWSRRNPSSRLPHDFTRIKDRVMGCFWDCSKPEKGERLWMYGSSWIFMLDLSRDIRPNQKIQKTGNLGTHGQVEDTNDNPIPPRKRKRNTGAGDEMAQSRNVIGIGRQMHIHHHHHHSNQKDGEIIHLDRPHSPFNNSVSDEDEISVPLIRHEKSSSPEIPRRNGTVDHSRSSRDREVEIELDNNTDISRPSHWHTFEYRSVMGICVLDDVLSIDHDRSSNALEKHGNENEVDCGDDEKVDNEDGENQKQKERNIEVIIIERPRHDFELGPRFDEG